MNPDKRDQLYDNLINSGLVTEREIGNRDAFKSAIKDESSARQFYGNLTRSGLFKNNELGSEDDFYKSISSDFGGSAVDTSAIKSQSADANVVTDSQLDSIGQEIDGGNTRGETASGGTLKGNRLVAKKGDGIVAIGEPHGSTLADAMLKREKKVAPAEPQAEPVANPYSLDSLNSGMAESGAALREQGRQEAAAKEEEKRKRDAEIAEQEEFAKQQKEAFEANGGRERLDEIERRADEVIENSTASRAGRIVQGLAGLVPGTAGKAFAWGVGKFMETVGPLFSGEEAADAVTAKRQVEEAKKMLDEAGHADNGWFDRQVGGAWRGQWNTLLDTHTWDFGLRDAANSFNIAGVAQKADAGEQLTPSEQMLMDALMLNAVVQEGYQDDISMGYKAGEVAGYSAGFAASLALNPASGLGREVAKAATKEMVKRYGAAGARSLMGKVGRGLARGVGDLSEALFATTTTQLPRWMENFGERAAGQTQAYYDEYGQLQYAGQEGMEKDVFDAFWKSFGSTYIENASEMAGEWLPFGKIKPITKDVEKGIMRFGRQQTKRGAEKLTLHPGDFTPSQWSQAVRALRQKAHFGGLASEYLEEVIGNFTNAATVGDSNFNLFNGGWQDQNSVFNPEQNLLTFLGVAMGVGQTKAIESGIPAVARGVANYYSDREFNKAYRDLQAAYGDDFGSLETTINLLQTGEEEHAARSLAIALEPENCKTVKRAQALLNFAKQVKVSQGVNTMLAKMQEQTDEEGMARSAFLGGMSTSKENWHRAAQEYEQANEIAREVFGEGYANLYNTLSEDVPASMRKQLFNGLDEEQRTVAEELFYNRRRIEGILSQGENQVDDEVENSERAAQLAEKEGMVQTAAYNGEMVFVAEQTDDSAIVINPMTGERTFVPMSRLTMLQNTTLDNWVLEQREAVEERVKDEADWALTHHPKTQPIAAGVEIPVTLEGGEGRMIVTGQNGDNWQLVQGEYDAETGTWKPKSGDVVQELPEAELLSMQDEYYVARDAASEGAAAGEGGNAIPAEETGQGEGAATVPGVEGAVTGAEGAGAAVGEGGNVIPAEETGPGEGAAQGRAIDRIPKDEGGNPMYEQASAEDTFDALMEQIGGGQNEEEDTKEVLSLVQSEVESAYARQKKLEEEHAKGAVKGKDINEKIKNITARKAAIENARKSVAYWMSVLEVPRNRAAAQGGASGGTAGSGTPGAGASGSEGGDNTVPDWSVDKARDARARGYRVTEGHRVDRRAPITDKVEGVETEVKFDKAEAPTKGRLVVVDSGSLVPSHVNGQRNVNFFIDEAQPKDRTDADSDASSSAIAQNINPEEITGGVTAYTGSPVVNSRGEVIQGNNRTIGLQKMWDSDSNAESQQKYKQYLIDHAEEFGLDAAAIEQMERPVLARMVDVEDDEAIRLGQKTAANTESGGVERLDPARITTSMGDKIRLFMTMLFNSEVEDQTLMGYIAENGVQLLKWLNEGTSHPKYISDAQYRSCFDGHGNLTDEAKTDLRKIVEGQLFADAPDRLPEMFYKMPAKAQNAILATFWRDAQSPDEAKIVKDIQLSIEAYHTIYNASEEFRNAKDIESARVAVKDLQKQAQLFGNTGTVLEKFDTFALELAIRYKISKQTTLRDFFNAYFDAVQGKGGTLFEDAAAKTREQAIKDIFEVDINETNNNDGNDNEGSGAVEGNTGTGTNGQPGRTGTPGSGEQVEGGEQPSVGGSGTIGAGTGATEQSEREQFIAEHPLTEAEIDASDAPSTRKSLAKAYLNGTNETQIAKAAYLSIYNGKNTSEEGAASETEEGGNAIPAEETGRGEGAREGAEGTSGESAGSGTREGAEGTSGETAGGETREGAEGTSGESASGETQEGAEGTSGETAGGETRGGTQGDATAAAQAKVNAILARMKKHKKPASDANAYSIEQLTPEQMDDMLDLIEAGAELGYSILDTTESKEGWLDEMRGMIGDSLKDATGYTDAEVNELLEDLWQAPYTKNGEERTIEEWAIEKGIIERPTGTIEEFFEDGTEEGTTENNPPQGGVPGSEPVGGTSEGGVATDQPNNGGDTESGGEASGGSNVRGSNSGSREGRPSSGAGRAGESTGSAGTTNGGSGRGEANRGRGRTRGRANDNGGTDTTGELPFDEPTGEPGVGQPESVAPKKPLTDISKEKVPYTPSSVGGKHAIGSVVPSGIADAIANAFKWLKGLFKKNTLDLVREELGYKSNEEMLSDFENGKTTGLASEQVDAVALAIGKMKEGKSFIVGDMTGVGKGRTAAALIRWGLTHGKRVLFITEKSGLFSDMHRDLTDIGCNYLPFVTNNDTDANITDQEGNKVIPKPSKAAQDALWRTESTELPTTKKGRRYDFVMTTYSQASNAKTESAKRKLEWLKEYAKDAIVIMDESHNASGESNRGEYFKDIVKDAAGVTFLSATYAKRPDNMLLYALRSSMSQLHMSVGDMLEAIKNYGVAMQELMASALFGSGEMIRRERDMTGVKTTWTDPKVVYSEEEYEQCRRTSDKTMALVDDIIQFQRDYVNPIVREKDKAFEEQNATAAVMGLPQRHAANTSYKSQVSNIVGLMVYAMKAKKAAQMAIEQIKQGKKPVIAVENTFGSYIDELGDDIEKADFGPIFDKGVAFSLRYSIAEYKIGEDGKYHKDKETETIFDAAEELDEDGLRALENLRMRVRAYLADTEKIDLTLSPIDLVKQMIADAGYSCGEITGRSTQLVKQPDGSYKKESIRQDKKGAARRYNGGSKDNPLPESEQYQALIVNVAGATGISLHSSSTYGNQNPRTMIILQPARDVNTEVQMRGRIDRTGQVHRGEYFYVTSPIPAEQKLSMMLKQKLASLDAQSVGTKDVSSNKVDSQDMDNKYGDEVCKQYLLEHLTDINAFLDNGLKYNNKTREWEGRPGLLYDVLKDIQLLPCEMQERIINELTQRYAEHIEYLNQNGINELESTAMNLEAETIDKATFVKGKDNESDNEFAHDTNIERVEVNVLKKPMRSSDIKKKMRDLDALDEDGLPKGGLLTQTDEKVYEVVEQKLKERTDKYKEQEEKLEARVRADHPRKEDQTEEEWEKMIEEWPSLLEMRSKHEADLASYNAELRAQRQAVYTAATYLKPGRPYLVPLTDDVSSGSVMMYGRFLGFQMKNGDPRQVQAVFAVKDSRAMISIPVVNKNNVIAKIIDERYDTEIYSLERNEYGEDLPMEERIKSWDEWWDRMIPKNTSRQVRYMITGNVLQACGSLGKYKGQIVTFTRRNKETGEITLERGMLLAEDFDPENFRVRRAVEKADVWGGYDEVKDEKSGISCSRQGSNMVVKFEKRKGEKLVDHPAQKDTVLKDMAMNGEIRPSGKTALLCVIKEADVEKALEHLYREYGYTKEELFVMPDSTEKPDAIVPSNRPYQEVIDEYGPKYGSEWAIDSKIKKMLKRYRMDVNNDALKQDIREAVMLRQAYLRKRYTQAASERLAWLVLVEDQSIEYYKDNKEYREEHMRVRAAMLEELAFRGFKGTAMHLEQGKATFDDIRKLFDQLNDESTEEGKAKKALFEKVMAKVSKLPMEIIFNEKINNDTGGLAAGRVIEYNWKYMNADYISDQAKADTILHELIHTTTSYALRCVENGYEHLLDQEMVDAVNELNSIYEVIKDDDAFTHNGIPAYGVKNVHEMLAEAGSNSQFREDLKKTSLWARIKSAFLQFFGFKTNVTGGKQVNAFNEIMDRLDFLIENFKAEAFEEYYRGTQYGGYGYQRNEQRIEEGDNVRFRFSESEEEFDETRDRAVAERGIVMPGLNEMSVTATPVGKHDFTGTGKQAIEKARAWARENIQKTHIAHEGTSEEFEYAIDEESIEKFLSQSSTGNSENLGVHLAVLKKLPDVIDNCVDVEVHPDYKKFDKVRTAENGVKDKNILIHRMYGVVEVDGVPRLVKITMQERRDKTGHAYDYRVTEIGLPISEPSTADALGKPNTADRSKSYPLAKVLQDVEKSYDNGKKVLAESKKEQIKHRRGQGAQEMDAAVSALTGRSRKQREAYTAKAREKARKAGERLANKLGLKVEFVDSVSDDMVADMRPAARKKAKQSKGWYDPRTRRIVVVVGNHGSADDVLRTVLHEGVAHHGLRELFGKDFDTFLDNVYDNVAPELKERILDLAKMNGWNIREATEEYLASLAEDTNFEQAMTQGWWTKIKNFALELLRKIGINTEETLDDADLRYMLYRSYENLKLRQEGLSWPVRDIVTEANDVSTQRRLGVLNYDRRSESPMAAENEASGETAGGETERENIQRNAPHSISIVGGEMAVDNRSDDAIIAENQRALDSLAKNESYSQSSTIAFVHSNGRYIAAPNMGGRVLADMVGLADPKTSIGFGGDINLLLPTLIRWGYKVAIIEASGNQVREGSAEDNVEWYGTSGETADGETGDDIRFRSGSSPAVSGIARDAYERALGRTATRIKEIAQDKWQSVLEGIRAVEQETGEKVRDYENPYFAMNRSGAMAAAEAELFERNEQKQLEDALEDIIKKTGKTLEEIDDYTYLKHALERNRVLAFRDTIEAISEAYKAATGNSANEIYEEYMNDPMRANNNAALEDARRKFLEGSIDEDEYWREYEAWARVDDTLREQCLQAAADKLPRKRDVVGRYRKNREMDYSGLTEMVGGGSAAAGTATSNADNEETAFRAAARFEQSVQDDGTDMTEPLWEAIHKVSDYGLRHNLESGLMSQQLYDYISSMFEHYVPLRGWDSDTAEDIYTYSHGNGSFAANLLKRAKGRRSKADKPIATLLAMSDMAINVGNRNLAKQALLRMAENHPTNLLSVSRLWYEWDEPTNSYKVVDYATGAGVRDNDSPEVIRQKYEDFETRMKDLQRIDREQRALKAKAGSPPTDPEKYVLSGESEDIPVRILKQHIGAHQVVVKRGGINYVVTVNGNPRLAQAVNGELNSKQDNLARRIARSISALLTSLNPEFTLPNFARDFGFAHETSDIRDGAEYSNKLTKRVPQVAAKMPGLLRRYLTGSLDMSKPMDKMFEEFMSNGGETGRHRSWSIDEYQRALKKAEKMMQKGISISQGWEKVLGAVGYIGTAVEMFSRWSETSTRFAAYMTSREMGRSIDRSIYDGKQITANFDKKGSGKELLDKEKDGWQLYAFGHLISGLQGYMPFFNAAMQGFASTLDAAYGGYDQNKGSGAKARIAAGKLFAMGAIMPFVYAAGYALMNGFGGGDDDEKSLEALMQEGLEKYYEHPEWDRRLTLIIGDTKIPLSPEIRSIYGPGEIMSETMWRLNTGRRVDGSEVAWRTAKAAGEMMPWNFVEGGRGFLPVPFAAWLDIKNNKSWSGAPIHRTMLPWEEGKTAEYELVYNGQYPVLVAIAKGLNNATRGSEEKVGAININPANIGYYLRQNLGGAYAVPNKTITTLSSLINGEGLPEDKDIPIYGRFRSKVDARQEERALNNEYYGFKNEMESYAARLKEERDAGNTEKVHEMMSGETAEKYAIWKRYDSTIKRMHKKGALDVEQSLKEELVERMKDME